MQIYLMLRLKKLTILISFSFSVANFSSAALLFLNVEGDLITSEVGDVQFTTPFTARYLVNTDVQGTGFQDFPSEFGSYQNLNSFSGAIESFEYQVAGNPSFFFENLEESSVMFQTIDFFGDFLFVDIASIDAGANPFEFDIYLQYDEGFFDNQALDFDSLLEAAIPFSSTSQPAFGEPFTDFNQPEGNLGMGVITGVRLSPVPEPSHLGLACLSFSLLCCRRKRA